MRRMWDFTLKSFLNDLKTQREKPPATVRRCDAEGCAEKGEHRAPKSRDNLRDYYWFCLEHVRAYNAQWDFFKGMSPGEMENHLYKTAVWERPTWRSGPRPTADDRLRKTVHEHFTGEGVAGDFKMGGESAEGPAEAKVNLSALPHPAAEALSVMGLRPPVTWDRVKARYKDLAKRYHPDTNRGDASAEETFKKITLAYTILKLSWESYEKLGEDRS